MQYFELQRVSTGEIDTGIIVVWIFEIPQYSINKMISKQLILFQHYRFLLL